MHTRFRTISEVPLPDAHRLGRIKWRPAQVVVMPRPATRKYDLRVSSAGVYHAARLYRAYRMAQLVEDALGAVGSRVRQLAARWRRWREAGATHRALRELDVRTLHDLGLDRSEIPAHSHSHALRGLH